MSADKKRIRPKKYLEISNYIHAQINSGAYKDKIPGINQLSAELDINRKTANRAVMCLVKKGLLVRRVGFGTFISSGFDSFAPSALKRINSRRYAVLIRSEEGYLGYFDLISGCDEVISRIGGAVIYTKFSEEKQGELLGRLRYQQIEGVIVCGLISDSLLKSLQREFSVLLIDSTPLNVPANAIVWNYYESAYQLGEYFARHGKKRVAFTRFTWKTALKQTSPSWQYRIDGIGDALSAHGIKLDLFELDWQSIKPDNMSELKKYLYSDPEKTVLVSDIATIIFNQLDCYDLMGKITISGFSDTRSVGSALKGIYIIHDIKEMGRSAGEIIAQVLGRPSSQSRIDVLKGKLVDMTKADGSGL